MNKFYRRALFSVPTAALLIGGGALIVPAQAAPLSVTSCGTTLSSPGSYALANDIGPCPGDGVDITASGVSFSLNGHTITGNNTGNKSTTFEQIGVNFLNVSGSTVAGPGTVTHFDAGISVTGGTGNTVKNLAATANVAHVLLTAGGTTTVNNLKNVVCNFGDGITTDFATATTISGNTVSMNGPFSGISLVDTSNRSNVAHNAATNNNVSNTVQGGFGVPALLVGHSGPCGPQGGQTIGFGRVHQDIGIRIEGPGATNNIVQSNLSTDNQLEGISVHGNVCPDPKPAGPPATPPNTGNTIEYNTVLRNGFADITDGISILSQGPGGIVCTGFATNIIGNVSNGNAHDGIFVAGRGSHNNNITGNTTNNNGNDGIDLSGPSTSTFGNPLPGAINNTIVANYAHGNSNFDGEDQNVACDNNHWAGNHFGTVSQPCIH